MRVLYAIAALALVLFTVREARVRDSQEQLLARAEQRADSAAIYADSVRIQAQADSARYAKEKERWTDSTKAMLDRANRAARTRQAVVTKIIEVAGDSAKVVQAATELEALHAVEVTALRSALAVSDSIIAAQRAEMVDDDYVVGQYRKALEAARAEARLRERAAEGGGLFGIRISPTVAFGGGVLVTLAAGVLLR